MPIEAIMLALLLALVFGLGGVGLLLGKQPFAGNMDRLRVAPAVRVLVGIAEVLAAVGLLVGLALRPLATAAAAGLVLLMIGAVYHHWRARDPRREFAPALVLGALSGALVVLLLGH